MRTKIDDHKHQLVNGVVLLLTLSGYLFNYGSSQKKPEMFIAKKPETVNTEKIPVIRPNINLILIIRT